MEKVDVGEGRNTDAKARGGAPSSELPGAGSIRRPFPGGIERGKRGREAANCERDCWLREKPAGKEEGDISVASSRPPIFTAGEARSFSLLFSSRHHTPKLFSLAALPPSS